MATSAAILPDSKSLIIPFRAVNLYAVDLSVIRIFENNVLMFMQNNSLSSANELRVRDDWFIRRHCGWRKILPKMCTAGKTIR